MVASPISWRNRRPARARQRGALMIELLVAIALLAGSLLPLAYGVAAEKRLARACYLRGVAMEIVDGEIEVLAAGPWRTYPAGVSEYHVSAAAAANLPPGHFQLTVQADKIRLEWKPSMKDRGGPVVREVHVK
jgi:acylphosphatase